jgi:NADP-dependent 3-hydroxy acid dehydrogenase YdfG
MTQGLLEHLLANALDKFAQLREWQLPLFRQHLPNQHHVPEKVYSEHVEDEQWSSWENTMANRKDVVVTGVSTGIGWGTTKVLVSKGFRVFGSVRKQADADRLQREFGNGFVPLMMDITDADAVHQAAQKVGSMIGDRNLVGLVNNAGIVVSGPLLYLRPSEYKRQLEVNMISPLVVIQAFAPLLGTDKKRQGPTGRIREHQLYRRKSCYPASRCL